MSTQSEIEDGIEIIKMGASQGSTSQYTRFLQRLLPQNFSLPKIIQSPYWQLLRFLVAASSHAR